MLRFDGKQQNPAKQLSFNLKINKLKANKKTKIMASSPITSWQTEGEKVEAVTDFILWGSKITVDSDRSHEIKRLLLSNTPLCICTTAFLSIHLLMDI